MGSIVEIWDVVIAGAGPAESHAATLLVQRGARVLLLDPRAPWEKPCGGGLTAAAMTHTAELVQLVKQGAPVRELLMIAPSGISVVVPLRSPFLVVSRLALARWGLERASRAGAMFLATAVRSAERDAAGWRIVDARGDQHRARTLVGADGAASRIRAVVAPGFQPELAPTRVGYPREGMPRGRAAFAFLPAADGYLWDFPRLDHHSLGVGIAPGTFGREALDGALDQYAAAETGDPDPVSRLGAVIATSAWIRGGFSDLGGRDYALLGDAGGLADPATGEGIDYALRSATIAATTYDWSEGFASYAAAIRDDMHAEMARARLVRRWLYHPQVAEWLVRGARRSPRMALLLMSIVDAINEHQSLRQALRRAVVAPAPDRGVSRAVCDCPDGTEAIAPPRGVSEAAGCGGHSRRTAWVPSADERIPADETGSELGGTRALERRTEE